MRRAHIDSTVREPAALAVRRSPRARDRGLVTLGTRSWPCALGRSGIAALKHEGDGTTPKGRWVLREAFYRPDRAARPNTALPLRPLRSDDGWCDDPADRNYNRPVRLPYGSNAESMWRKDHLYDLVVVLGYNDRPRRKGAGSAIFMHLARDGYAATQGCIALAERDLRELLARARPGSAVRILL